MKCKRRMAYIGRLLPLRLLAVLLITLIICSMFLDFHIKSSNSEQVSDSFTKPKKYDHIVLGPAAGQGIAGRIQCNGLKALTSKALPSKVLVKENISFVTVFAMYDQSIPNTTGIRTGSVKVGNVSHDKTERAMALLNVFSKFIEISMPRSNIIILTDPASNLPFVPNNMVIKHMSGDYSRHNLMLQRIKCYIEFLEERISRHAEKANNVEHFVFTDSDVAVVDDLSHLVSENLNFHIGLTFRNNKEQPLNSGFIFVNGTNEAMIKAKAFLERVLYVYKEKFKKASRMLGDQMALAWVVRSQPFFNEEQFKYHKIFSAEINGTNVLFLPCYIYNWTPPEGAGQFHGMPEEVKVIHFKGSRKRLMLESWNYYSSDPVGFADMMCLILKSGRTKYDFK